MCELVNYVEQCTKKELDLKLEEINSVFECMGKSADPTTRDIDEADIIWVARVAAGLEKLVKNNNLSGLAYYYMGENENIYERVASSLMIGNSLMTSKGVTMAGEADMKTCMAMYLTSSLGFGGTFSELCHVDFSEDILLVGHDGPHDIRISDRKPAIRGLNLYHGKKGHGVSVEFSIKHGPITMVGFGSDADGKLRLIVAQGESRPGWVPPIGNTLTRGYFGKNISKFVEDWSKTGNSHHQALAAGHCGDMVEKFGKLMNIEVIKVR
jgi:L-arabinose isomerase